jgi:hypothetical protein
MSNLIKLRWLAVSCGPDLLFKPIPVFIFMQVLEGGFTQQFPGPVVGCGRDLPSGCVMAG